MLSAIYHLGLVISGFVLVIVFSAARVAACELIKKSVDCWFDRHFH
ncbi:MULTISPECIES: hypothetical protein [Limosilactobacillus]|nr:hypothetical protein [Limosilactobacillus reuteri]MRI04304.1 hypothetical protein [Limosilactobacillus reuteri]